MESEHIRNMEEVEGEQLEIYAQQDLSTPLPSVLEWGLHALAA